MYVYIAFYICTMAVLAIFELGWRFLSMAFFRWRFNDCDFYNGFFETHRNYTG